MAVKNRMGEFHKVDCSAAPKHSAWPFISRCNVLGECIAMARKIHHEGPVLGQVGSQEAVYIDALLAWLCHVSPEVRTDVQPLSIPELRSVFLYRVGTGMIYTSFPHKNRF